ncbi:unnamed protein product [Discula destructiva]
MVNTGKPSGGCKLCRARRIKCDETKPACLKCLRTKRQCPGYRDPFDGRIRDETQATIKKYKQTRVVVEKEQVLRQRAWLEHDDWGGGDEDDVKANVEHWTSGYFERGTARTPPSASTASSFESIDSYEHISMPLATPVEQQAVCHLLADYILISDAPGARGRRGHYKFVYKIIKRPGGPSKCLMLAFKALSFAALSSRPGASSLMIEAESYYAKALREVGRAIQDPFQVKSDSTLAAVLLLAFYETLASTRETLDEYTFHIKGAAHLVKMRGLELNDTDEGAEMYSVTRNQIIAIRSMGPSDDQEDYSWLLTEHCPDAYVSRVASLTIACSDIRMKLDRVLAGRHRGSWQIQTVTGLLRKAQAISHKLSNLDQPQNAVWTVNKEDKIGQAIESPPGDTYNFHNLYTCGIYCIIWTSHLFLTTCIFRCMAWLASTDDWQFGEEYAIAVQATKRRIGDIVASMPYTCTWNGFNSDYGEFAVGRTSPDTPTKGVAGLHSYRPAFTAMMSDYATPKQKAYLHGCLKFLAGFVGIKQVNILLKLQGENAHPSKIIERDKARLRRED